MVQFKDLYIVYNDNCGDPMSRIEFAFENKDEAIAYADKLNKEQDLNWYYVGEITLLLSEKVEAKYEKTLCEYCTKNFANCISIFEFDRVDKNKIIKCNAFIKKGD